MRERYSDKEPFSALEAWARDNFPSAGRAVHRWSSVVFRPAGGCGGRLLAHLSDAICLHVLLPCAF